MDQHIIIQIYTQARKAMDIQMTIISVMLHIPQDEIPVQQASPHPHPSQKAFVNHSSSMQFQVLFEKCPLVLLLT